MPIELIHVVIATVFLAIWAYIARIVLHECCRDARTRHEVGNIYSSVRVDERHMEGVGRVAKTPSNVPCVEVDSGRQTTRPMRHLR